MSLVNIASEYKLIRSWNLTYYQKAHIFYPSSIKQLRDIIKRLKKRGETFAIRTGECSYDSKSIPSDENCVVVSLKKFNKIIQINKKKTFCLLNQELKFLTLYTFLKEKI